MSNETFIHLIQDCPAWWLTRRECFLDHTPCNDMRWSVRALLDYSYTPKINDAFEGTWAHGDPRSQDILASDSSNNSPTVSEQESD